VLHHSILELVGNTPLVEIPRMSPKPEVSIYAKLEGQNPTGSSKDRAAKWMIDDAERTGKLTPDKIILEPTSGNTGIALAMIGRVKGYHVKVVMPDAVSVERTQLLQAFGAEIVYSEGSLGTNGSIKKCWELYEQDPGAYFMPYQYGNEANPQAHYEGTGPEILQDVPDIDVFVAGLGTGGTLTGVARYLKEQRPGVRIVAAVPNPGDLVQGLRSLKEGFIPPILDESLLDGKIAVDSETSFRLTKELTQKEGIFAGISSGAAIKAAQRVAARMDRGKIVVLLADGGWKYLSTGLWSKDWQEYEAEVSDKIWW
jgi:cysteine synthase B